MVMDRAYEGDETRQLVLQLGFEPVVPPNPNRLHPWAYDRGLYRRRNEVEQPVRRRVRPSSAFQLLRSPPSSFCTDAVG